MQFMHHAVLLLETLNISLSFFHYNIYVIKRIVVAFCYGI